MYDPHILPPCCSSLTTCFPSPWHPQSFLQVPTLPAKHTAAILAACPLRWHNVPFMLTTSLRAPRKTIPPQTSFLGPTWCMSPLPLWIRISVLSVGRSFSEQGSPDTTQCLYSSKTTSDLLVLMREWHYLKTWWRSDLYPPWDPNFSGRQGSLWSRWYRVSYPAVHSVQDSWGSLRANLTNQQLYHSWQTHKNRILDTVISRKATKNLYLMP